MLKQETKATHNARTKIPAGRSALAYIGLDYNSHEPAKTTKRAKKKKKPSYNKPIADNNYNNISDSALQS